MPVIIQCFLQTTERRNLSAISIKFLETTHSTVSGRFVERKISIPRIAGILSDIIRPEIQHKSPETHTIPILNRLKRYTCPAICTLPLSRPTNHPDDYRKVEEVPHPPKDPPNYNIPGSGSD